MTKSPHIMGSRVVEVASAAFPTLVASRRCSGYYLPGIIPNRSICPAGRWAMDQSSAVFGEDHRSCAMSMLGRLLRQQCLHFFALNDRW